jgi:hypothetical protein
MVISSIHDINNQDNASSPKYEISAIQDRETVTWINPTSTKYLVIKY